MTEKESQLESDIKESLTCPICRLILINPIETQFCGELICKQCENSYKLMTFNVCSKCKKFICFRESFFAKKLLNKIKSVKCSYNCGHLTDLSNLRNHMEICSEKKYECHVCKFSSKKDDFKKHFIITHEEEFFKMVEEYREDKEENKKTDDNVYELDVDFDD
jgi:hypothetical protein